MNNTASCNLGIQRVPINIMHGEIAEYFKSRSDEQVKFYSIFKAHGFVYYWWQIQEHPPVQTSDIIDVIRQSHFSSAQLESYK